MAKPPLPRPPEERPAASRRLEVKTERDTTINLANGKRNDAVRVLYRKPPARRWTRFLLVADEGQDVEELERHALEAAALHAARIGAR